MSNQTDEQMDELKKLVDQVEQGEDQSAATNTSGKSYENPETADIAATKEIDVLNLPPRNEVHSKKKKHVHIKISAPFIRLFIVVLIILVVSGGLYYGWEAGLLDFGRFDPFK